jgi:hypothetical protein
MDNYKLKKQGGIASQKFALFTAELLKNQAYWDAAKCRYVGSSLLT